MELTVKEKMQKILDCMSFTDMNNIAQSENPHKMLIETIKERTGIDINIATLGVFNEYYGKKVEKELKGD